jgi:hypothetical protein
MLSGRLHVIPGTPRKSGKNRAKNELTPIILPKNELTPIILMTPIILTLNFSHTRTRDLSTG